MRKRRRFWEQVRDLTRRLRAKRPRKEDDPPAASGVRSPLLPRTPVLSGGAALKLPPED
jgi:hypothetical protein